MITEETRLESLLGARPLRYFSSLDSTMLEASRWLAEEPKLSSGALVVADEQTSGRGRLARQWVTPPATAIAMSLILRGDLPMGQLTMLGTVAVAEILEGYAPDSVGLRWSNDVLLAGKKVCGVLAEALWEGNQLKAVILGIGVNVTVDFTGSELEERATSLMQHTSMPLERPAIITAILKRIDVWLASRGGAPLFEAWRRRLVTLGQPVTVYTGGAALQGKALDVDPSGALIVQLESGEQRHFLAADVSLSPR